MDLKESSKLFLIDLFEKPNSIMWLLFLSGLSWRIIHWGINFPQGGDETFVAISILTRNFEGMLRNLEYGQIVPVGFMWLELASAKLFGFSGLSLRLIPALALILSLILFWRLCLKILITLGVLFSFSLISASSSLAQAQINNRRFSLQGWVTPTYSSRL